MLSINSKALVLLTLAATSAMPVLAVESNKDKLIASTLTQIHSLWK